MKHTLFALASWLTDPRHIAAVILLIMLVVALTAAILPTDVAIAGEITSGS